MGDQMTVRACAARADRAARDRPCVAAQRRLRAAQPPPTTAAQDGFVPIDQLPPKEEMPAAPLVMAAYAVAWLVIFGYVWSLWRRLHKVELEIADVSRRMASGGRR